MKEIKEGAMNNYSILEMKVVREKNGKGDKEYFLNVSILEENLKKFKKNKKSVDFSFNNLILRYEKHLETLEQDEVYKAKSDDLKAFIRFSGIIHNLKWESNDFSWKHKIDEN